MAKWIQKAIQRPGRLKGMTAEEIRAKKRKLHTKAEKGQLSKEERSYLAALTLGERFKSGEFKRKRKKNPMAELERRYGR
jgi:hypothetical protein